MAIDPDLTEVVREALEAVDTVDARQIEVVADGDVLVLRGGVATHEEASAAASVATQHAFEVRNELRVDVNLREDLDNAEQAATPPAGPGASSTFDPTATPDDLVSDLQESLTENVPWDPPHEAVEVPTRAEARGIADTAADDDQLDGVSTVPSLPDMTAEELSRAAHPQARDEETA